VVFLLLGWGLHFQKTIAKVFFEMVNFKTAFHQIASRVLPVAPAASKLVDSLPNSSRNVPPDAAQQQINEEIPFRTTRDAVLQEYLNKYTLKSAGIGFVTPPYNSLYDRIWGVTPIDDLPKLQALYEYNPYVAASVDVRVNLTVSNWLELEGGNSIFNDYLSEWLDSHNVPSVARIQENNALVNGFSITELCRDEDNQRVEWLKPLDPLYVRIRRDAYMNVFGYIQLLSVPPAIFEPQDILRTLHNQGSGRYNSAYGVSLLRSMLLIQALTDDFQHDMATIMKIYTKPILAYQCGTEKAEWSDIKLQNFINGMAERQQGTDLAFKHDVNPIPIDSMTRNLRVEWWLNYLLQQREAQLGVPKIFLGQSEGTNRATADIVMQEFVTRLRMRQEHIKYTYETELFPAILQGDFPGSLITPDKIPKIEWRPIWEPSADIMVDQQIALFQAGLIGDLEARAKLGLPEEVWGNLANMRQAYDQGMPAEDISKSASKQFSASTSPSRLWRAN
jgi:hypothetical protein